MPPDMSSAPSGGHQSGSLALTPDKLFRPADLSHLEFETTRDLAPAPLLAGQQRAKEAISLGTGVAARGFNIFATGRTAARISSSLHGMLEAVPPPGKPPLDWVYVNNFAAPHRPAAIALPAGRAVPLQRAMRKLIEDLRATLPALFESDDYQRRRTAIDEALRANTQKVFQTMGDKAAARGVAIIRTPMGFTVAAMEKGAIVDAEAFGKWPEERQQAAQKAIAETEREMEESLRSIPKLEKERRDAVHALDQETARFAISQEIDEVRGAFSGLPQILDHLAMVRDDLLQHVQLFLGQMEGGPVPRLDAMLPGHPFERYDVNVLVANDTDGHPPVVEELNPTLGNLLGRVEHMSFQGALVTNFRMIKAGSLHRANGGTIVIDARSLFSEPYAWAALKRVLVRQEIVIEDLAHIVGLMSTATLEPGPIPLNVKVVLFGERLIYYLLAALDPEFLQHFKILADFEDELDRSPESEALLARLIGGLAAEAGLQAARPRRRRGRHRAGCTAGGGRFKAVVARGAHARPDHRSGSLGRCGRPRRHHAGRCRTSPDRTTAARLACGGEKPRDDPARHCADRNRRRDGGPDQRVVGVGARRPWFGRPSRITARVGPGGGKIVDIEREVELGGPIHSKGVLILSGFISGRYALDMPISLQASLVFEQSYGGIEGDSASLAELCALLSALAGLPLRQDLAVTGSVNQHGRRPADRRREREDRGLLRYLRGTRIDGAARSSDPHRQCATSHVASRCRSGL